MFHGWGSGTFYIQSQSFCGIPDKFRLGERGRDNVKLFLVFLFSKGKSQNKTIWEGGSLFPPSHESNPLFFENGPGDHSMDPFVAIYNLGDS